VKCEFGVVCFVQQYVDHDPGSGAKDYRCGTMTYDRHNGTDLRVSSLATARNGVDVVAAAPGVVERLRDGMDDMDVHRAQPGNVAERECGNGVVIAHAGGWETQYCHMAKGSISVTAGQSVPKGAVLGRIGMSGNAEFPHLDFTARHAGIPIDPFAWDAPMGTCGSGHSLWSARAAVALAYHSPDVINAGFASGAVAMDDVESGRVTGQAPTPKSPALVAYVRAIGLRAGDVLSLSLFAPDGSPLVQSAEPPLEHDKAQWLIYAGKKRTTESWAAGRYRARYEVRRNGATVLTKQIEIELR
jgi:hypothetical protein